MEEFGGSRAEFRLFKWRFALFAPRKKHYVDELDFSKEAENLKRVRAGLGDDFPDVGTPKVLQNHLF